MPELNAEQNSMRKNNDVQSILFSRRMYDIGDVCAFSRALGYNCTYVDTTKNYYRVRQFNPGLHPAPRYKTIDHMSIPGIKFVIEY